MAKQLPPPEIALERAIKDASQYSGADGAQYVLEVIRFLKIHGYVLVPKAK